MFFHIVMGQLSPKNTSPKPGPFEKVESKPYSIKAPIFLGSSKKFKSKTRSSVANKFKIVRAVLGPDASL